MLIVFVLNIILFSIGLFSLIYNENLFKKLIFLSIIQTSIIMFFLIGGISVNGHELNFFNSPFLNQKHQFFADPVPQALMLTAIVVGFATTALGLSIVMRIQKSFRTLNDDEIDLKIQKWRENICKLK